MQLHSFYSCWFINFQSEKNPDFQCFLTPLSRGSSVSTTAQLTAQKLEPQTPVLGETGHSRWTLSRGPSNTRAGWLLSQMVVLVVLGPISLPSPTLPYFTFSRTLCKGSDFSTYQWPWILFTCWSSDHTDLCWGVPFCVRIWVGYYKRNQSNVLNNNNKTTTKNQNHSV